MRRTVCQKSVILLEIVNLPDARSAHLYVVFVPDLHSALMLPNLGFQKDFFIKEETYGTREALFFFSNEMMGFCFILKC